MPVYKLANKKGCWYFSFQYKGKRIKREKWDGDYMTSKAMATTCEYKCKQDLIRQEEKENGALLLSELFDEYVTNTKSNLKASSQHEYTKFKRNYLILIDDKLIYELTPKDLSKWNTEIVNLDMKVVSKNKILNIMRGLIRYGQMMYDLSGKLLVPIIENIKDNNIDIENKKDLYLPPADFEKLISPLKHYPNGNYYEMIIYLLYNTGLRISELSALTTDDFKNNTLRINKDYVRVSQVDYIQSPKNKNSIRVIPLNDKVSKKLNDYITNNNITGIIFHLESPYLNQQRLRRVIEKLSIETDLIDKYDIHPHSLRHSFNTNLKNAGVDIYTRSRLLGNTPEVNAETYTHTDESKLFDAVNKI